MMICITDNPQLTLGLVVGSTEQCREAAETQIYCDCHLSEHATKGCADDGFYGRKPDLSLDLSLCA